MRHAWIRGDKVNKENLNGTIKTMKIYNEYRASGNFGSMRAAKSSKKDSVWAIFGGSPNGKKAQSKSKGKSHKMKKSETVTSHSESNKKAKILFKEEKQKESPKDTKEKLSQTLSQKKLKKDSSSGATSPRSVSTSTGGKVSSPRPVEKKISEMILPFAEKKRWSRQKVN